MTVSPHEDFATRLAASVDEGTFARLTLGKPRGGDPTLQKVIIRPVVLKAGPHLSFVWRHNTQDITKNLPPAEALREIGRLLGTQFHSAHLDTTRQGVQLEFNKKGEPRLTTSAGSGAAPDSAHDHQKERLLPAESQAWLQALGVTAPNGVVKTGMADKHRQIHKFVEVISHLAAGVPRWAPVSTPAPVVAVESDDHPRELQIVDMGCGKGYLTFATHDYFDRVARQPVRVCGVEARPALVAACNQIARDTGRPKLSFIDGTIQDAAFPAPDVLIALHACDTATDDALARGLKAGAALIVVSPCCQKELRPQLHAAPVLAPALRHGIWQERHAEFVTDALRALLLEWAGYDTKVFEFISTEHTARNLMIAATKRTTEPSAPAKEGAAAKVRELAAFYGIKTQAFARQLGFQF